MKELWHRLRGPSRSRSRSPRPSSPEPRAGGAPQPQRRQLPFRLEGHDDQPRRMPDRAEEPVQTPIQTPGVTASTGPQLQQKVSKVPIITEPDYPGHGAKPEPSTNPDLEPGEPPVQEDAPPSPTAPSLNLPSSAEDDNAIIWKQAYDSLHDEHEQVMTNAEAVLKDHVNLLQEANMSERLADGGRAEVVREKIDSVVELASQLAGLVSAGMTFAPPVRLGAIDGLESTAKFVLSCQLAEGVFLGRGEAARKAYTEAVLDLYKMMLEYQARAIEYFGKSTLERLGRNFMRSTVWSDMLGVVASVDNGVRRSLTFKSMADQAAGFSSLEELLRRQEERIDSLIETALANTDSVRDMINWVSGIPIENDHADVRLKLGEGHQASGQWFLKDPYVKSWMEWEEDCRFLWLRGGMGTGKSSLTSILVEKLVQAPDGIVAIFYCSKKIDEKAQQAMQRNNVVNVVRSLLGQSAVSTDGASVYEGVKKRYRRDRRRALSGFALVSTDCLLILAEMISKQPQTRFTIAIDALDECEDYDELSKLLHPLSATKNVRLFFSSRLEVNVKSIFTAARDITILSQNSADIERFLNVEIPRRRDGCGITDSQINALRGILTSRANGMVLWSDIALKLAALEDFTALGEELLKAAFDDEYDRTTAFGTEPGRSAAVISALRPTRGAQEGDLLEFCSNLLVEDSTGIMQLAHGSVRHYLETRLPPDFVLENAHMQAALTSLYFKRSASYDGLLFSTSLVIQQGNFALTKGFTSPLGRRGGTRQGQLGPAATTTWQGPEHNDVDAVPERNFVYEILEKIHHLSESDESDMEAFIAGSIAQNADLSSKDDFGDTALQ
ncbi:hypothetical protein S40288_01013 [Stachybotrys chartarum IBT 40288]|nr:hypothetical protein S40288_01013 [Stachybotrys chartarum IBT 40288]